MSAKDTLAEPAVLMRLIIGRSVARRSRRPVCHWTEPGPSWTVGWAREIGTLTLIGRSIMALTAALHRLSMGRLQATPIHRAGIASTGTRSSKDLSEIAHRVGRQESRRAMLAAISPAFLIAVSFMAPSSIA